MYVSVSIKEILYDNGKKVHVANTDIRDLSNLLKLVFNGKSRKVRVSAAINFLLIMLLVLIPILLLSF